MANTNRYLRTRQDFQGIVEVSKEHLVVSEGEVPYDIRTAFKNGATKVYIEYDNDKDNHAITYTMHERNE